MIYQSRRWRLLARVVTLSVTSLLMLLFAGPVTYALQSDSPRSVASLGELFDKEHPIEGSYIDARGVPDLANALSTSELLTTHYWIPVKGYDHLLLIRTDDPQYLFPSDFDPVAGFRETAQLRYIGKVVSLKGQLNGNEIVEAFAAQGVKIDRERAVFISQGEIPSSFRTIVPVVPFLAWAWFVALVGLVQLARRRRPRFAHDPVAARN
jgi:hypothetical protein